MEIRHKYLRKLEIGKFMGDSAVFFDQNGKISEQGRHGPESIHSKYDPSRNGRQVYEIVGEVPEMTTKDDLKLIIQKLVVENKKLKERDKQNSLEYSNIKKDNMRLTSEISGLKYKQANKNRPKDQYGEYIYTYEDTI